MVDVVEHLIAELPAVGQTAGVAEGAVVLVRVGLVVVVPQLGSCMQPDDRFDLLPEVARLPKAHE